MRGAPIGRGRRLLWLVPATGYAAVLFWLSDQANPFPWVPGSLWDADKLLHAGAYLVLAALLALGLRHATGLGPRRAALVAVLLASLYGVSDEVHQSFVPNRTADVADWVADVAGAVVGGLLAAAALRRRAAAG
ncbi:MAG: VanZ family protein [Anaeromyxobacter sp.]|nr:VanZ family protein [Anaeromyxobacter sp.]MBL0274806.1 VanZ family protein [Anaeromyxobacter sp.]